MDRKSRQDREFWRDALALAPPRMTVLSDRPLRAAEAHHDSLNLAVKLGPIYDIIRHPDTQTPLAVAVYGDWGTGKTSAMKWLEGLLHKWNQDGDHGDGAGKVVRPVWFYPWKYHDKEDVWRGLIAEVILASIDVRGATMGRIKKAIKEFGLFLGRSFLHVLAHLKLSGVGSQVNMQAVNEIYESYKQVSHPEAGYLNEFEHTLTRWIKETISDEGERMVIFIDDLDRCMPDVALQVLEALKLYLNIDDLVFVIGVDRAVIDQLVREHYARLGLDSDKSKNYLAKMFQVEVVMAPTENQAEFFFDEQLTAIGEHTNQYWSTKLDDTERRMFRGVVLRLAQRNPRELKRLLNSALIHGAGGLHVEHQPFSFAQGMQVYLVRKILEERYTMGLHVDTNAGMRFFHAWSRLVRAGAPRIVERAPELAALLGGGRHPEEDAGEAVLTAPSTTVPANPATLAAARQSPYAELLQERRFAHLLRLLADTELGELMQVEYPADTSALAEASLNELPRGLIHEAVARQYSKAPTVMGRLDYTRITHLDLEGLEISDITPLASFVALQELVLSFTQVSDLRPLSGLSKLEWLSLANTPVTDLTPLESLVALTSLSLANTPVTELAPLRYLSRLQSLNLRGVGVSDLGALATLTELTSLSLANMPVADLAPLRHLARLTSLSLVSTQVTDVRALADLAALESLHLSFSRVADLTPLATLSQLDALSLAGTQVADLAPLHGLSRLRFLDVRDTQVSDGAVAALRAARPETEVRR